MSKSKKQHSSASAEEMHRQKIGIFLNNFMQAIPVGHQSHDKHIKRWNRGQIVWKETEIDELIKLGAPIEVYYKWL